MPEISNLQVVVGYDDSAVASGVGRTSSTVEGLGSKIQTALGAAAVGAVAGLGAAFVGSVKTAMDFEKQISAIAAVSGEGAAGIDKIRATALQLGKDTSFSASEAAAGMEEIIKAGLSVEQVVGGAGRAVLDLSAASGTAVEESARIMSNVLNTFATDQMTAAQAADLLTGAANASATSVHELGYGLASVGNVAATMGLSFKDTNDALALFAQNGLKGSDAGTSLKTMLLNLTPQTDKQVSAMSELGLMTVNSSKAMEQLRARGIDPTNMSTGTMLHSLEMLTLKWDGASKLTDKQTKDWEKAAAGMGLYSNAFFDASGNVKSLSDISGILKNSLKDLTKEQQITALQTIFGTDAIRAAAIMAKAGAEGFNEMDAAVQKQGDAQAVANERLNNLAGSMEKFGGSVETAAIMLGSFVTPALQVWADNATEAVNQAIDAIDQIPDVIATVKQVLTGDWAPDDSIRPFTNEVGKAAVLLRDTFGPAVTAVAGFITGTLVPAFQRVGQFIADHTELVIGLVAAFATFQILTTVVGWIGGLVAAFGAASAAITAAGGVIGVVVAILGGPLTVAILAVSVAVGLLAAAWVTDFGGIQATTAAWWAVLQPILASAVDWLQVQLAAALTWLATTGWPLMLAAAQTVSEWITAVGIPAFTALVDWLGPQVSAVVTWLSDTGWPALVTAGVAVSDWITSVAIPALTELVNWLGPQINTVTTWIYTTGWPALVTAGTAVGTMVTAVTTFFQALYVELDKRGVFTELATIWDTLTASGNLVWQMVQIAVGWWQQLHDALLPVQADVGALVSAGMLAKMATDTQSVGSAAQVSISPIQLIGSGIKFMLDQVTAILSPITNFIQALNNLKAIISNFPSMPSFSMPSFGGGGGGAQTMSFSNVAGAPASEAEIDAYIRQSAAAHGHDPETAVAVSRAERVNIGAMMHGDSGSSFGPFQLHMAGLAPGGNSGRGMGDSFLEQTGLDPRDISTWRQQVDFSMANLGQTGWAPWHAAAAIGVGNRQGVGSGAVTMPLRDMQKIPLGGNGSGPLGRGSPGANPDFGTGPLPPFMQETFDSLPDYLKSLDTIQQQGTATYTATAGVAKEQGLIMAGSQTDALGNVTSVYRTAGGELVTTTTDTSGQVTGQYATLAGGVTLQMGNLAAGVTTQQQQLGSNILTTVADTAGNYVGTVTTMSGQIISQYAGTATGVLAATAAQTTGVQQQYDLMGTGVTSSIQATMTGVNTTLSDGSGNMVTTVTTANGAILTQYATLANGATLTVDDMNVKTTSSFDAMSQTTKSTMIDLAGNVVTTTTDMGGKVIAQTVTTTGAMKTTWLETSAAVIKTAADMGLQVQGESRKMGDFIVTAAKDSTGQLVTIVSDASGKVVKSFKTLADEAGNTVAAGLDVARKGFDGLIGSMKDTEKQAKNTEKAVDGMIKSIGKIGGSKDEKDSPFGKNSKGGGFKALGGPVNIGETYLVGEKGPELFTPNANGTIIPNNKLAFGGGGGPMQTILLQIEIDRNLSEKIYIQGRDITIQRTGSA